MVEAFDQKLRTDAIYMRRHAGTLLMLNPFFLSYPTDFDVEEAAYLQADIGLLSAYIHEDLRALYNMPISGVSKYTSEHLDALKQFLKDNDLQAQQEQRKNRAEDTWPSLRAAAAEISAQQIDNTNNKKYDRDTYLNREEIEAAFSDFLAQPSTCFVLLGKSGVGKSSFVIARIGDVEANNDNSLIFMFEGQGLAGGDLMETIFHAVDQKLKVESERFDGEACFDFLQHYVEDTARSVLIVVDAINESSNSDEVMASINRWALLAYQRKADWLKFVVTCRPHAWRNIRRVTKLDQQVYYRPVNNPNLAFELKGFGVQIGEFDARSELQKVYDQYARKYGVVTPLEHLPPAIREDLRDPLLLKVVMSTYGNDKEADVAHHIDDDVTSHDIIDQIRSRSARRGSSTR